jgi:DNA-binding NtrC family response regulator
MLTTSASPLLAVEAMRAGATDYLIKPVAPDRMMHALRAATREAPRDELQPLTEKMHGPATFEAMIGAAPLSARRWPLRPRRRATMAPC